MRRLASIGFDTRLLIAFASGGVVVAAMFFLTGRLSRAAMEATELVSHTHQVRDVLAEARAALHDVEASTRGFIIAGEARRLREREAAVSLLEGSLERLRAFTADNASQSERWSALRAAADERLASSQQSLDLARTAGSAAARDYLNADELRQSRRLVVEALAAMGVEEQRLLESRVAKQARARKFVEGAWALAALALAALLAATFFLVRNQLARRARAESSLRQSEEGLATTLHSIGDAVLAVDVAGRVTRMNAAAERLTGWPLAEAHGRYVDEVFRIVHEETRAPLQGPVSKVLATGEAQAISNHAVILARDGTEAPISESAAPIRDASGATTGVVLIFRDVTDHREASRVIRDQNEKLEQRTRQLEQASHAKSDFLANMSHELRTPLNSIIGFSEMLRDGVLGPLEAKQRNFVGDIFDSGKHLLSLINDILDLSKIEAGSMQVEPQPADIAALLRASAPVVRERALANRIALAIEVDPALGTALVDERKVKQIVYNLLSNALKFTADGGTVTLRAALCTRAQVGLGGEWPARMLPLPAGEEPEFIAISVEDTGAGIPEAYLPKLFEPFTQLDSSLGRREGGSGLGLSIVRRLAELHGGTIGVASSYKVGSRFCVWLPYRSAPLEAHTPASGAPAALASAAGTLALIVEDDAAAAGLIEAKLRAEGFEVMRAVTAEEGLALAARHRPGIITLDIHLPSMDGWEFMRRLKADPLITDTPVVVITVSDDRDHCLALGARRVLQKPFTRDELRVALAGLTGGHPGTPGACVLVADDNVQAVELLAKSLKGAGYRVMTAYGGAEAIRVARRAVPDVVILDLVMPEVDGFAVMRALRESQRTAHIPILVLTAKDLTAADLARLGGDAAAVMAKASYTPDELLAEVHRAMAAGAPA